jgi:2-oxoisovalerate dehydrogenase E1 component
MTVDGEKIRKALLIRRVEEKFLELFSQGKLNGTVHTCIGQEFSALAFAGQLQAGDYVFSNHRCHGHYLAFTGDLKGLIAELLGKVSGICAGVGSSQHLCGNNFFSNGIQGGMVPVAAGFALAAKLSGKLDTIVTVFIGDGTLGEGLLYETMNIVSKWELPLLIVCEDNRYAQSTPSTMTVSGDIAQRAQSFGISTGQGRTEEPDRLFADANEVIRQVRSNRKPFFYIVETNRLAPHSKGDDCRDIHEIEAYKNKDFLYAWQRENAPDYEMAVREIDRTIDACLNECLLHEELSFERYAGTGDPARPPVITWEPSEGIGRKQVDLINEFFDECMNRDNHLLFMGEDVLSPYGGAFKVAQSLSRKYPDRVITTPLSEAAITGIANGAALSGLKPYLEIMFGDFLTLCLDQIINHASKFYHMYNKQVSCPVVIRTPMGGRRGYGPTHSQTLDKWLVGIDMVTTVALSRVVDPRSIYQTIHEKAKHPVIVIENKLDYGKKQRITLPAGYIMEQSNHDFPIVRIRPVKSTPTATLVTYGGMVEIVVGCIEELFTDLDIKPEVLVLSRLCPIDGEPIAESVSQTGRLYVIEEGTAFAGIGSEIIATVKENLQSAFIARRIASLPFPIPACRSLEDQVLTGKRQIVSIIKGSLING